jgi:dTDP-4-amino-4,6-dideoxygalactose transaminase
MRVPLLDLRAQYERIRLEIEPVIHDVVESQYFVNGPQVMECETAVAEYSSCTYGVGVSSGTDALLVSLMSEDIGRGDEVITTPYTFFATAGCIARLGARPVFVDIDPFTYNLEPELIESCVTDRTKAILPVHLYGQMADMNPIMDVAQRHDLLVIEDAAQAIGSEYDGRRAGSFGDYGCFSFFPSKNLGCFGDGGMVVTNDPERAERMRRLRNHGSKPKYYHGLVGGNFRLDTLQAAVVTAKLCHLDAWTAERQSNAARYDRLFDQAGLLGSGAVSVPQVRASRHIFNQYVVQVQRRDELREHLRSCDIGSEIYYPTPMHLQECFADLGYRSGDFPHSERAARDTLALPIYPELTDTQAGYIVEVVANFYAGAT